MVNIKIPEGLPDCELIKILAERVGQRHDIDFNFFSELDNFRKRVSNEMRQVNQLFPEYTPHDEQYHLKRLFYVVDTIIGKDRLEMMNSAELFVLAIGLYGHDWGMAVSEEEKQYILTNELSKGKKADDLWLLPDEHSRLAKFAHKQRLIMDAEGRVEGISVEMWRDYVRETHALRSSERVRRFFDLIDGGIAMAASRVCEGHWLEFEELQDYCSYPPDFSVLRQTVNLRAIAVYVRLVDLLDLAEDRTPYVIWKFVAPKDPRSKMAWAMHRALRPVTSYPYQNGRIIKVDGNTNDHEVYAALEDLRIWCEKQLRGCRDTLARMNDDRHKLDIYHIEWRVVPQGFKSISIQFEFDRERMFEILSEEIYNGDHYVFLRELLQNSIDGIRMRREVLEKIQPKNLGVILVNVEHGDNGDAVITWRDDGIGMDEYIIRNYLAVAGKSYYRSSDFERQGLKMDPISKFGIGILSCFVAANRIEIETFKEPHLPPMGEKLKIIIPAINRQFRIESLPQEGADVGTTVKVFVEGKKIPTDDNKNVKPLDVTAYLSIVAGFVEFPIVITEGDRKTIILHPKQDVKAAKQRFGEEFKVHQLDLSYPWSEVFLPQDLPIAREVLREEHWDIASDLNLEGYDGVFTCLVPIDNSIDLTGHNREIGILRNGEGIPKIMRTNDGWESYFHSKTDGMSQSSMCSKAYAIYRDGILLSEASSPRFWLHRNMPFESDSLPIPRIVVNIPKTKSLKVDLARSRILGQSENWDLPICHAYQNHILKTSLKSLLELNPAERLYQMGRLMAYYNIEPELILEFFPHERLPLTFLEADGLLSVVEWQEITGDMLYDIPIEIVSDYNIFGNELEKIGFSKWLTHDKYNGFLVQWKGKGCIVLDFGWEKVHSINKIGRLQQSLVKKFYRSGAIQFLNPPWGGNPPLLQNIMFRKEVTEKRSEIESVLEKAKKNPALLNPEERELLIDVWNGFVRIPEFIEFPQPFEQFFAYGAMMLNIKHPVTQALFRFAASLKLSMIHGTLPKDRIGNLQDALNEFLDELRYIHYEKIRPLSLNKLWQLSREVQLFDMGEIDDLIISSIDFVPGTSDLIDYKDIKKRIGDSSLPFGKPL